MKSVFKRSIRLLKGFMERMESDHVSAYAAQSSYFIFISAFPLAILIFNLIRYTPVTESFLLEAAEKIIPKTIYPLIETLINEMFETTNGTVLSITIVLTIWSASKGVMAIVNGLGTIFKKKDNTGYFKQRIIASIYTIIFVIGIVLSLVLMVFGNSLLRLCEDHIPMLYDVADWLMGMRILYIPVILTLLFVGLYMLVNEKKYSVLSHIPGAFFSAIGWMGFSYFYSLYVDIYASKSYTYGSLTTIVLLMLWLYICMYILFIGAEITVYFRKYMKMVREKIKTLAK